MTCPYCEKQSHVYNMLCIGCLARHVRMMFYPAGIEPKKYCKELANKYNINFEDLLTEIRKQKGNK